MKDELQDIVPEVFAYYEKLIEDFIKKLPKFMQKIVGKAGIKLAGFLADINWIVAKSYTPKRFEEEMKGIAEGSGVKYKLIKQLNMLPELTKAACTVLGAWGESTLNNELLTLRALDWDNGAPVNKYPLISVYEPSEKDSVKFANIGYAGLIAILTGVNAEGVALSEKVWIPSSREELKPKTTYFGKPWGFVLRDIL